MIRRATLLLLVLPVAALVTGCGGGAKSASSGVSEGGATVAPSSAQLFVQLNTAFDSAQWQTLDSLLQKFPDGMKPYSSLAPKGGSFEEDVKPALGPETDVLALTREDLDKSAMIGMTRPADEAKFTSLLQSGSKPKVAEQIGDWQVFADDRAAIDRLKEARNDGTLADSDAYKQATGGLPADAAVRVYVAGDVLRGAVEKRTTDTTGTIPGLGQIGWLGGALTARDDGATLDLRLEGGKLDVKPYAAELPAQVPADVVLFLDFKGIDKALDELRKNPAVEKQLGSASQLVGSLLGDLIGLFADEGALYVRGSADSPEVTLVLSTPDEKEALASLEKLVGLLSAGLEKVPADVTVAGVPAKRLDISDATSIYYAAFSGKLVVTNAESGIEGLKDAGERLADAQAYKDAAAAAELPGETAGFLYGDVAGSLPLVEKVMGKPISAETRRNLEPLGSALFYGTVDGTTLTLKGFLGIR